MAAIYYVHVVRIHVHNFIDILPKSFVNFENKKNFKSRSMTVTVTLRWHFTYFDSSEHPGDILSSTSASVLIYCYKVWGSRARSACREWSQARLSLRFHSLGDIGPLCQTGYLREFQRNFDCCSKHVFDHHSDIFQGRRWSKHLKVPQ